MAKQEVRQALANLGYKSSSVEIATVGYHRLAVWADDVRIGVYDMDRHTFVD